MTATHKQNSTAPTIPVVDFSLEPRNKTWKQAFTWSEAPAQDHQGARNRRLLGGDSSRQEAIRPSREHRKSLLL